MMPILNAVGYRQSLPISEIEALLDVDRTDPPLFEMTDMQAQHDLLNEVSALVDAAP